MIVTVIDILEVEAGAEKEASTEEKRTEIGVGIEVEKEAEVETVIEIGTETGAEKEANIKEIGIGVGIEVETIIGIEKEAEMKTELGGMNHQSLAVSQGPRKASLSTAWDTTTGTSKAAKDLSHCRGSLCTTNGSSHTETKSRHTYFSTPHKHHFPFITYIRNSFFCYCCIAGEICVNS